MARTVIAGGRVYRHGGATARPDVADVVVEDGRIVAIEAGIAEQVEDARRIDATGRLLTPGFVNAHYHSHDVLLKGMFEPLPLNLWFLNALPPVYPPRGLAEIRARTLLGAVECLEAGMTTTQDMVTLFPADEARLDAVLRAYDEIGIRSVMSLQFGDLRALDRVPYWREVVPEALHDRLGAAIAPGAADKMLDFVEGAYVANRDRSPLISWALSPTSPAMASAELLSRVARLAARHDLPVTTHLYETRAEAVSSRKLLGEHGGSEVRLLAAAGLLGPRLTLAHAIWLLDEEIELIAEAGAGVVLNPAGNLKTKSGVAPIRRLRAAGVEIALGSDNCSCNDAQNMFQAMKLFCGLAAIEDPEDGGPDAEAAIEAATRGGARRLGLAGTVGEIEVGRAADLVLLDLSRPSFVPLNHAARQFVYGEAGAEVDKVLVAGRLLVDGGRCIAVDRVALAWEAEDLAEGLRADAADVAARFADLAPHVWEAWRQSWRDDVGVHRYVGRSPF